MSRLPSHGTSPAASDHRQAVARDDRVDDRDRQRERRAEQRGAAQLAPRPGGRRGADLGDQDGRQHQRMIGDQRDGRERRAVGRARGGARRVQRAGGAAVDHAPPPSGDREHAARRPPPAANRSASADGCANARAAAVVARGVGAGDHPGRRAVAEPGRGDQPGAGGERAARASARRPAARVAFRRASKRAYTPLAVGPALDLPRGRIGAGGAPGADDDAQRVRVECRPERRLGGGHPDRAQLARHQIAGRGRVTRTVDPRRQAPALAPVQKRLGERTDDRRHALRRAPVVAIPPHAVAAVKVERRRALRRPRCR